MSALGKSWHPEHFTCTKCKKALQNQSFVVEGEDIFCEPCYEKSVAPQCEKCKAPITGVSEASILATHVYSATHLVILIIYASKF